jgi:hypothetical protein
MQFHHRLDPMPQIKYAASKGLKAWMSVSRLTKRSSGLSYKNIKKLYTSVVLSRTKYMASVWFHPNIGESRLKPLIQNQRLAMKRITGCLRGTSLDAMEFEADVLPVRLQLELNARKTIARLLTRDQHNPLHMIAHGSYRTRHSYKTPFQIFNPNVDLELISPPALAPWETLTFNVTIAKDKATALRDHIVEPINQAITIYTDGCASGQKHFLEGSSEDTSERDRSTFAGISGRVLWKHTH